MLKNKILNFFIFTSLVLFVSVGITKITFADEELPDNVKIITDKDGSSTTIVIDTKPGFVTKVESNCVNGKCTNKAISNAITAAETKKMEDDMKQQQEVMNKFWKLQEEFFKQQQQLFHNLWEESLF